MNEPVCIYRVAADRGTKQCLKPATHELRQGQRVWYYCDIHATWVQRDSRGKWRVVPLAPVDPPSS